MASTQHMATFDNNMTTLDNNVLESSMDSTQGLLSFMTNASRQIKTYLGPESNPRAQKRHRRHQMLLQQLSQLKSQNYNFIPDILKTTTLEASPVSPTPSLDSVGSVDEEQMTARSSCVLTSGRKRSHTQASLNENMIKRSRYESYNNCMEQCVFSIDYDLNNIIPSISTTDLQASYNKNFSNQTTALPYDTIVPSPSPDFDDLVECMLTEDSLSEIDVNNYFPAL